MSRPNGVFRTFAWMDAQQEIEVRNGDRDWRGGFRGFSARLIADLTDA